MVRDQLLGSTQPVLSISLESGESVVGRPGEFAWMTDSIQMTEGPSHEVPDGSQRVVLSTYCAKGAAGVVAFATRLPGSILGVDVTPGREYLVHRSAFLAGTPGIAVSTGFRQPLRTTPDGAGEFVLRHIGGRGRAWVELSGDVVKRDLAGGTSLRTHPWHIGMCDSSVTVQMAELRAAPSPGVADDAYQFAVLSGPGSVWLQSLQLPATPSARLTASTSGTIPTAEGPAGQAETRLDSQHAQRHLSRNNR
ncbi:MAG TPA: AIM24 family protein [Streptosporangiaceae bacterium]